MLAFPDPKPRAQQESAPVRDSSESLSDYPAHYTATNSSPCAAFGRPRHSVILPPEILDLIVSRVPLYWARNMSPVSLAFSHISRRILFDNIELRTVPRCLAFFDLALVPASPNMQLKPIGQFVHRLSLPYFPSGLDEDFWGPFARLIPLLSGLREMSFCYEADDKRCLARPARLIGHLCPPNLCRLWMRHGIDMASSTVNPTGPWDNISLWMDSIKQFEGLEELIIEVPRCYAVIPPTRSRERSVMHNWVSRLPHDSRLQLIYIERHRERFSWDSDDSDNGTNDGFNSYSCSESEQMWENVKIEDRASFYDHLWEKINGKWKCRKVRWKFNEDSDFYDFKGKRGILEPIHRFYGIEEKLKVRRFYTV